MIEWIFQEYESIFEDGSVNMSVIRGKVHEYLLMTLYYTVHCQVRITIFSYIKETLTASKKSDPKGKGKISSAATNNIFVINKDRKKIDQEKVVEFQNLVAKTLYATKQAIPDTCTNITFITTRV